mgnify:CR=1 FL=1
MSYDEILKSLKNRIFSPVYLFHGDEPYFIDLLTDYISDHVLDESAREFNQTVLYGLDVTGSQVVDIALRYPVMSSHQVVIVREAQNMDKELEALVKYATNPFKSTILVIAHKYKKVSRMKGLEKIVQKNGVVFESKKLYENHVGPWIDKHLEKNGYRVTPEATQLLAESLGTDLSRIVNECSKLMINLPKGTTITPLTVEQNVGISKDYNIFELTRAITNRKMYRINQILLYFSANPKENPPLVHIVLLFQHFYRIWLYHQINDKSYSLVASALGVPPFTVKDYIEASKYFTFEKTCRILPLIHHYEMRAKGVNNDSVDDTELFRELVYRIMTY